MGNVISFNYFCAMQNVMQTKKVSFHKLVEIKDHDLLLEIIEVCLCSTEKQMAVGKMSPAVFI